MHIVLPETHFIAVSYINVATYFAARKVAREYGVFTDIANLVVFDVYVKIREFSKSSE